MSKRQLPHTAPLPVNEAKPIAVDAGAPFICFDHVSAMGVSDGAFDIVLSVSRPTLMNNGEVPSITVIAAQLRCNLQGLGRLRDSIEKLILLASKTQTTPN